MTERSATHPPTGTLPGASATPVVTIMIPTYNQAGMLDKTIRSALQQDYPQLEVLVVDDASADSTPQVAARYTRDPRFVYVRHAENMGRVRTYHDGLYRLASGSFVLNLDGDDWLSDTTYVSSAMELFDAYPDLALVFARSATYDESNKTYVESNLNRGLATVLDGRSLFQGYASDSAGIPHLTAIYRKDLARSVGFYDVDVIGADSVSFLKLLPGRRVGFIDSAVAVWRNHGHNTSHVARVDELVANFAVADVPAAYLAASGALTSKEAASWRSRMAASLGYRHLANLLADRQFNGAAKLAWFMARSRPVALAYATAKLVQAAVRKVVQGSRQGPRSR